jgi:Zn-dependent protease
MFSIFSNIGPEIPFSLFLMALLGLRAKVWPRASVFIRATPDQVFSLIDLANGKSENWGRTTTTTTLADAAKGLFQKTYTTTLTTGVARSFAALFSIRSRQFPEKLEIQREGLEGRSLNNELISQVYAITPVADGCRLAMTYEWGPRPLIAQLVARADLWGGAFRIKGLAETGRPVEWPYQLISAGVAVVTGALSFLAFAVLVSWQVAALFILALFLHELGHLLAYRLMGQPWGRMIFLPFLGAIAIPRLPFENQGQLAFAALMGPGFSAFLAAGLGLFMSMTGIENQTLGSLGVIMCILNLFNLLPLEPLDGGVALRCVLARYLGANAKYGLMAVGLLMAAVGLFLQQILLLIFGGIAIVFNLNSRPMDPKMTALSTLQVVTVFAVYVCMTAAYVAMLYGFANP